MTMPLQTEQAIVTTGEARVDSMTVHRSFDELGKELSDAS